VHFGQLGLDRRPKRRLAAAREQLVAAPQHLQRRVRATRDELGSGELQDARGAPARESELSQRFDRPFDEPMCLVECSVEPADVDEADVQPRADKRTPGRSCDFVQPRLDRAPDGLWFDFP
jgi:hypothetical protein